MNEVPETLEGVLESLWPTLDNPEDRANIQHLLSAIVQVVNASKGNPEGGVFLFGLDNPRMLTLLQVLSLTLATIHFLSGEEDLIKNWGEFARHWNQALREREADGP